MEQDFQNFAESECMGPIMYEALYSVREGSSKGDKAPLETLEPAQKTAKCPTATKTT